MSIKAVDLNYVYGNGTAFEQHALFDVNFEIQDGEFVGIIGHTGSGKSTLLHTLITGIIRNYHPDDVELWLADFKMSEFAQYIDPLPPHVKYILLDESKELVFDLIDRLTDKMMERQRFFMKHRDLKKVENVPSDTFIVRKNRSWHKRKNLCRYSCGFLKKRLVY